jgi:hypothetical protein
MKAAINWEWVVLERTVERGDGKGRSVWGGGGGPSFGEHKKLKIFNCDLGRPSMK